MATPTLTPATRYFDPAVTKCYWVETIVNKASPTRIELTAGLDVSGDIADLSGFTVTSNQIDTPDLGTRFTSKIGGRTEAADSSLTFYASNDGVDIREEMPRDATGFIVWLDGGDVPDNKMSVFPVTVISVSPQRSVGNDPARIMVQFSITSEPAEGVAVPALT